LKSDRHRYISREKWAQLTRYEQYKFRLLVFIRKVDCQKHNGLFRYTRQILRRINVLSIIRSGARAYNEIPMFAGVYIQGALLAFMILGIGAEPHPLMIGVSLGGGMAVSVTVNALVAMVRRMI